MSGDDSIKEPKGSQPPVPSDELGGVCGDGVVLPSDMKPKSAPEQRPVVGAHTAAQAERDEDRGLKWGIGPTGFGGC